MSSSSRQDVLAFLDNLDSQFKAKSPTPASAQGSPRTAAITTTAATTTAATTTTAAAAVSSQQHADVLDFLHQITASAPSASANSHSNSSNIAAAETAVAPPADTSAAAASWSSWGGKWLESASKSVAALKHDATPLLHTT